MKKILLLLVSAGMLKSYSQECKNYLFLQNNKTIEMSVFNKKNEPAGKTVYTVSNVTPSGSSVTASLTSEVFNSNGRSLARSTAKIRCEGGILKIDMQLMLPPQPPGPGGPGDPFGNTAETKIDSVYLEYPSTMNIGDKLKDASFTMTTINHGPGPNIKTSINMTDRKVEAKESITTPAGTWDCYRISYKSKTSGKAGPISFPINLDGVEWYAPGVGIVKTQNKNGTTELTSIK